VVITTDAVPGVSPRCAMIADRCGEILHIEVPPPGDISQFPSIDELLSWVRFARTQCPECPPKSLADGTCWAQPPVGGRLPVRALPRREQRFRRRVAHDALVDVDTVRYSVAASARPRSRRRPRRRAGRPDLSRGDARGDPRASRRAICSREHYAGFWRGPATDEPLATPTPALLGRDLTGYAAVVAGGGQ
jgi:hypothetical protein